MQTYRKFDKVRSKNNHKLTKSKELTYTQTVYEQNKSNVLVILTPRRVS